MSELFLRDIADQQDVSFYPQRICKDTSRLKPKTEIRKELMENLRELMDKRRKNDF